MTKDDDSLPPLNNLFEDLMHPNPHINREAYLKMAFYWPKESLPLLLANLDHENIALRRISVKALGAFGRDALLPLAELFSTSNSNIVRTSCLKGFVQVAINIQEEFPPYAMKAIELAFLDESPEIILTLIPLLKLLEKQGIELLLRACRDDNILRASAAVTALGECDDPKAKKILKEMVDSPFVDKSLSESVIDALNTIEQRN